ncbi:MAG: hypothetical protein JSU00_03260 [Acidobacteria bacterium]|nr:hypothetical protein [Acidobacteriota bacterium]
MNTELKYTDGESCRGLERRELIAWTGRHRRSAVSEVRYVRSRAQLSYSVERVPPVDSTQELFSRLARTWLEDTSKQSSVTEMVLHPCYQRIIGMGPDALPYIFRDLERKPGHWFWALKAITGVNPVAPENTGRIKFMAQDWLNWARSQGIRW